MQTCGLGDDDGGLPKKYGCRSKKTHIHMESRGMERDANLHICYRGYVVFLSKDPWRMGACKTISSADASHTDTLLNNHK